MDGVISSPEKVEKWALQILFPSLYHGEHVQWLEVKLWEHVVPLLDFKKNGRLFNDDWMFQIKNSGK